MLTGVRLSLVGGRFNAPIGSFAPILWQNFMREEVNSVKVKKVEKVKTTSRFGVM